jgi:hypothetical protein
LGRRPFAGPEAVLAYLAPYTHRVAIANSRLGARIGITSVLHRVSIGAQSGPRIGIQEGPHFSTL